MKLFKVGENRYWLRHKESDDSRVLVCENTNKELLKIDINLYITATDGVHLGSIVSDIEDVWVFRPNNDVLKLDVNVISTKIGIRGYHWIAILEAEVMVCKFLLLNNPEVFE